MLSSLKNLFATNTGKDTAITFLGTLINIIVGGLFFVLAPRILGPENYGVFSTIISTSVMLLTIANFGLDTGILRYASQNQEKLQSVTSLALKVYVVLAFAIVSIGFLIAPLVERLVSLEGITSLLRIGFAGSAFILLSNFFIASLQANGQFKKASIVGISANLTRLILLLVAVKFIELDLLLLTLFFFVTPVVSVLTGLLFFQIKFQKNSGLKIKDFFIFNIPIAVALIISSVPYENYLLINLSGVKDAGIYSAPFKILTFAYMFGGNFTRVLAKRYASFDSNTKALTYSKKSAPIAIILAVATIASAPLASRVVSFLFGPEFDKSIVVYQFLTFGFAAFFLSTIPSSIIIYYFGKSSFSLLVTILKYSIFIILLFIFIPTIGAKGAAISFSCAEIVSLIVMSIYVLLKLNNGQTAKIEQI